jgi:hypothetical protein
MKFKSDLIRILFFFCAAAVISWQSAAIAAQLQLNWVDNSSDESGFNIERKTGTTGTYAQIASVGANVTSYTDSSLTSSTTYCYRVNAFNNAGTSLYSPEACATTPAPTIQTFPVAVTKMGTGTGTVSSSPAGINCGSTCSGAFNSGAIVALTASADSGSIFAGWTGDTDCSDGSLTMNAGKNCTAAFNLQPVTNTVSTNIANNATLSGSSVVWTATASSSPARVEFLIDGVLSWTEFVSPYQFNGDPSGTLNTTTLTNSSHQLKVRAVYADNSTPEKTISVTVSNTTTQQFTLTINVVKTITSGGTGNGTVTSSPSGINCGTACSASYNSGTTITLTATPGSGSAFGGWTGCTNGVVTLTANTACTATFNPIAPQTYTLSIIKSGTGNGTVTSSPSGINCGSTCSATYNSGTAVSLTPAPASGSTFAGWSGTGCASGTVTMNANITCTASFQPTVNQLQSRIGVFRSGTGEWFLDDNGNGQWDTGDVYIRSFGKSGDLPVVGSWSGNGVSNIGTFTPATGMWQLDTNGDGVLDCAVDTCAGSFGQSGDFPVTREIGGTTGTMIGTYTPETTVKINGRNRVRRGHWRFDNNDNSTFDGCSIDQCDTFSVVGEIPVVGDWNGTGIEQIALFTSKDGTWYLDRNENEKWDGCNKDKCLGQFGTKGDIPIVGDWDGTGKVRIGVFRPSTSMWYLDLNGNGKLDACGVDACIGPFGQPGDLPVVGKW